MLIRYKLNVVVADWNSSVERVTNLLPLLETIKFYDETE